MSWRSTVRRAVDGFDAAVERTGRRCVLMSVRTAMHAAVLDPIARELERDPRIDLRHIAERPDDEQQIAAGCGRSLRWTGAWRARGMRVDLLVNADPWCPPTLYRCRRRVNFFHGVAGKYDLDSPGHLPAGFEQYDRVAFVNADRMRRYLEQGIIRPEAAVLVGFPKIDALVNGGYDAAAVRSRLGLEMHRRTAIYAPTWSPASSFNLPGEGDRRQPRRRRLERDPQAARAIVRSGREIQRRDRLAAAFACR